MWTEEKGEGEGEVRIDERGVCLPIRGDRGVKGGCCGMSVVDISFLRLGRRGDRGGNKGLPIGGGIKVGEGKRGWGVSL